MSACQHILSSTGNFLPRETGSLTPGGLRICSSKVLGDLKGLCACNVESLVPLSPLWGPEFSHPRIKECFFFSPGHRLEVVPFFVTTSPITS